MSWDEGVVRPVALEALGQRYRRYRLADPPAEEAMAGRCGAGGSCRRWWRACASEQLELLDGFKRQAAARQVAG